MEIFLKLKKIKDQFHGIVNLLIKKTQTKRLKSNELNLEIGEYVNIEELALAHVYIAIMVIVNYDPSEGCLPEQSGTFLLSEWKLVMQNILTNFRKDLFGW